MPHRNARIINAFYNIQLTQYSVTDLNRKFKFRVEIISKLVLIFISYLDQVVNLEQRYSTHNEFLEGTDLGARVTTVIIAKYDNYKFYKNLNLWKYEI